MLSDRAAIVGIGQTEFSKKSGRTELRLAVEAITLALADAGLPADQVDGLTTFTYDTNPEIALARALGIPELTFFSRVPYGGGAACGVLHQATMAVATGAARTVVAYRALNMRSGARAGSKAGAVAQQVNAEEVARSWYAPFGIRTPAAMAALFATRYGHEFGATSTDFGMVSVASRAYAATNPDAWFHGHPITLEEHQASRWIVEPLRLLDCCQESDGAVAVVVTTPDRARELRQTPAMIRAVAQGAAADQHEMTSYYRPSPDDAQLPEMALVGRQLYRVGGLGPADVDAAMLYDHFSTYVLPQLEAFGFCAPGEAADLVRSRGIGPGGALPVNTHGGQLGEGYLHGMNGITEAVRQIRGTAANQLAKADNVLVTAGAGVPTSGAIIGRQR
jgi:acetyl-CoA acetyltransferase